MKLFQKLSIVHFEQGRASRKYTEDLASEGAGRLGIMDEDSSTIRKNFNETLRRKITYDGVYDKENIQLGSGVYTFDWTVRKAQ